MVFVLGAMNIFNIPPPPSFKMYVVVMIINTIKVIKGVKFQPIDLWVTLFVSG